MKHALNIKNKVNKIKSYWKNKVSLLLENNSTIEYSDTNKILLEKILLLEGLMYEILYNIIEEKDSISKLDLLKLNQLNEINKSISNIKQNKKTIFHKTFNDTNSISSEQ